MWLKGLPKLNPTNIVSEGEFIEFISKKGIKKKQPKWYFDALKLSPSERAKARSKTFPGIAQAMADQWGELSYNSECTVPPTASPKLTS